MTNADDKQLKIPLQSNLVSQSEQNVIWEIYDYESFRLYISENFIVPGRGRLYLSLECRGSELELSSKNYNSFSPEIQPSRVYVLFNEESWSPCSRGFYRTHDFELANLKVDLSKEPLRFKVVFTLSEGKRGQFFSLRNLTRYAQHSPGDVSLVTSDGQAVTADHSILSASSDDLRQIFVTNEDGSAVSGEVMVEGYSVDVIQAAVDLLHGREVANLKPLAENLFRFANHYKINCLLRFLEDYFITQLNSSNIAEYLMLAQKVASADLKKSCLQSSFFKRSLNDVFSILKEASIDTTELMDEILCLAMINQSLDIPFQILRGDENDSSRSYFDFTDVILRNYGPTTGQLCLEWAIDAAHISRECRVESENFIFDTTRVQLWVRKEHSSLMVEFSEFPGGRITPANLYYLNINGERHTLERYNDIDTIDEKKDWYTIKLETVRPILKARGALIIICEFGGIWQNRYAANIHHFPERKSISLSYVLKSSSEGNAGDITIVAENGFEVQVNCSILVANSKVFRAMFSHKDTIEAKTRKIKIEGCGNDIVRSMVDFLHDKKLDNLALIAEELLILADRYELDCLRAVYESEIVKKINSSTVGDILLQADTVGSSAIKHLCLCFIRHNLDKKTAQQLIAKLSERPELKNECIAALIS